MKILVCGDRNWHQVVPLFVVMDEIASEYDWDVEVIEGQAPGADLMSREWAESRVLPVHPFPADWNRYGKAAGPKRNQQMLDFGPDLVVAFHQDLEHSRGTGDMVRRALRAEVTVWHFNGTELIHLCEAQTNP